MDDCERRAASRQDGLSTAEAAHRLAADGPNALPDHSRRGWPVILGEAAREPIFLLLIGAALLYLLLGEPHESVFLLLMVVLLLGMTLYQEGRTERALQALRDLSAPTATVVRDGRRRRIDASAVVRGDVIVLAEGDRVPADAVLLATSGLLADESLLTGESVPVGKRSGGPDEPPAQPGGADLPWVFAGTLVVQGDALALVAATGAHSELGRIGAALGAIRPQSPDPIEEALRQAAAALAGNPATGPPANMVRDYGFTANRPAMVRIWNDGRSLVAAAKGAPETIAASCVGDEREGALAAAAEMACAGLRVLAVAEARGIDPPWPDDPLTLPFRLLGLVALADPLRADIPAAVAECRGAGVRVLMVTGDHPDTAGAIARQAGLAGGSTVTGPDIAHLDTARLAARLEGASVCARIVPAQKLAIVRALQQHGAVVAMTGDGVNDAPALRAADVGVAMGLRGTDVAREAAELTLLDDRFAALVLALRAGRRIFSNMRKSMRYVAAAHVPITVLALLPPLLGWPVLLYPPHIVFLELVIDPACSLAFENEPEEPDLMRRPPRPPGESVLGRRALLAALLRGLWAALLLAACYGWALARLPRQQAGATAFAALILCNLGLLLSHRQRGIAAALRTANVLFAAIGVCALVLLAAALYVPAVAVLFRFEPPPAGWLGLALSTAVVMVLGLQLVRPRAGSS